VDFPCLPKLLISISFLTVMFCLFKNKVYIYAGKMA
jgi:hypothetical protein